jgi:hypothetical protein
MKYMSKFIFSILLILTSLLVNGQTIKTDSIPPKIEKYGVRFGADISKLIQSFYDKNYTGIEFVGDYRLTKNYYLAGELGNENTTVEDNRLSFTTQGTYLKVGFDYNSYENWLDMRNMLYIGMRYGASTFSQTLNSYNIYNTSNYFPEAPTVISGEKFNGLTSQWIEVVLGLKAEVLKNIYLGFSVRMNRLLTNTKPDNFDNLYIPGFNRTYNGDFGIGFNYSVSYFLPLYKTKSTKKEERKKKK